MASENIGKSTNMIDRMHISAVTPRASASLPLPLRERKGPIAQRREGEGEASRELDQPPHPPALRAGPALSRKGRGNLLAVFAVLLAIILVSVPQMASAQPRQVRVAVSSGTIIEFPRPARSVFIADPNIADVQVPSPGSVIVFGRKPGQTTLFAIGTDDKPIAAIQVMVGYELGDLQRLIRQELPNSAIELTSTASGFVISGTVATPEEAEKARSAAARYIGDKETLVNQLHVTGPAQVNLRVRVAEVSRTVTKELGFNWESVVAPGAFAFGLATGRPAFFGGGTSLVPVPDINGVITRSPTTGAASGFANFNSRRATVNSLIDALAEEGLITVLAEPNLTAVSGQVASFLAGGEFPIPVAQSGTGAAATITIEFKQFGVSLDFVPTVLSPDRISIKVRPEVSEINLSAAGGAITLVGITIPGLNVRRAETTVELGSGQSFAIAGLIRNNANTDISKVPGLGEVPILGTLFRSSRFQRNETELVIIVTPYVVRPVSDGPSLRLPTDGLAPATDIERIFRDRLTKSSKPETAQQIGLTGARLQGNAGFIFE
jgi:pilus assembly protein CpaC